MDDSGARFTNANFQEVPSHSSASSKDGGSSERESKSSEGKSKKSSSHSSSSSSSGSRGRKSNPSKSHGPVVTIATSSTVPSSTSPFQQGEAWFGLYHAQLKKATTIKCESWPCVITSVVMRNICLITNHSNSRFPEFDICVRHKLYSADISFIRSWWEQPWEMSFQAETSSYKLSWWRSALSTLKTFPAPVNWLIQSTDAGDAFKHFRTENYLNNYYFFEIK